MKSKLLLLSIFIFQLAGAQDLFLSVEKNDLETVKKLLDGGASPHAVDEYGDAILMHAALYASADCMKLLLDKGADPNFKNKQGESSLMWCVQDSNKVKVLLAKGADINAKANSGNTALLIAAVGYNNYELVKWLIDKGADPMAKNKLNETVLMRTVPFCDARLVKLLVEKGNPLDSMANTFTPLSIAIAYSNSDAAIALMKQGADPNLADGFGIPLGLAVVFEDTALIHLLIKNTKNINSLDIDGFSPLAWALYNEYDRPDIIQALIDHGADVNMVFKNGSTPLSWAMQKGQTRSVELLKKAGAKK